MQAAGMQEPDPQNLASPAARYLIATRPGFLGAAVIPVLIGLATVSLQASVHWWNALLTLLGAVVAHAGINVLNDVYDDRAGCDAINNDRVHPYTGGSRIIQNGVLDIDAMLRFGWLLLLVAVAIGLVLASQVGPGLVLIGLIGLFLGWAYSAPPLRLSGRGLGEMCVAIGFGLVIPLGTAYVQLGRVDALVLWAGLPFAFLITLVLYVNQFPDLRTDRASGKRNWVVRLGADGARSGYPLLVAAAYLSLLLAVFLGRLPVYALIGFVTLPLHLRALRILWAEAANPTALRPAIESTLNGTMLHGLLLAAGVMAGGLR
jgi:1,4-dihydroxy-2-naphthoate octaprenyltransferase